MKNFSKLLIALPIFISFSCSPSHAIKVLDAVKGFIGSNKSANKDTQNNDKNKQEKNSDKVNDKDNKPKLDSENNNSSEYAIIFKDGSKVESSKIIKEIDKSNTLQKQKMKYDELVVLFAVKDIYEKLINQEADKLDLDKDTEVMSTLEKKYKTVANMHYLTEQVNKLMTHEALEKFYNETFDKYIKGTKQISLILITLNDKKKAEQLVKEIKSEEQVNKLIKESKANKKSGIIAFPLNDYPEGSLPPEIVKEIKAKGEKCVVGPFKAAGMESIFFVKSIHDAKKMPFTKEVENQYRKLAFKDFVLKFVNELIVKYKVEIYDLNGKKIDPFKHDLKKPDSKNMPTLSNIKADQLIAKIGNTKVTVQDIYNIFNIKSLDNDIFGSMALQLKVGIENVIQSAIRLCVQDKLIELEIIKNNYMNNTEIKEQLEKVKLQHLRQAYFAKKVKITESEARKEYNKYIKMMRPEDKNDQEVSTRIVFYKTKEDASNALKQFQKQPKKFSDDFANQKNKLDLGYIKKQNSDPMIWEAVKDAKSGVCCQKIIQVNGELYGFKDMNYVVAYIGDRRQVKLPSFQEVETFFRQIAEKIQAAALVLNLIPKHVQTINGKDVTKIPVELLNNIVLTVISMDNESTNI